MNKQELLESLKEKGFSGEVIHAFSKVKRENFIEERLKEYAYEDKPLPIGEGQTISQPYTIAIMLSMLELKKGQKVLEIGSGCGYVLALISEIVGEKGKVYGIERIKSLADNSKEFLREYKNIEIYNRNGIEGLREKSPFERIIISAGYDKVPKSLVSQLKDKGILVAPLGGKYEKSMMQFQKINNKLILKKEMPHFSFVPLIED